MTWFDAGGAEMLDRYRAILVSVRDTECYMRLLDLAFDVHKDAGFLLSQE